MLMRYATIVALTFALMRVVWRRGHLPIPKPTAADWLSALIDLALAAVLAVAIANRYL